MKAAVIEAIGEPPRVTRQDDPSPAAENEVVIKVDAAALNPIDLHIAAGHHRAGTPQLPYVPGIETVGTIIAGLDQGVRVRATAPAGLIPGTNGGLAELQVVDRTLCVAVPDDLDRIAAAAIGAVGTAADLGLTAAMLKPGESVLVNGATGPLGNAFLQFAKHSGAERVIAAGRSRDRLAALPSVDGIIALDGTSIPEQLEAAGGPVDLITDSVWGEWAQPLLRCLKRGGRYLNVGAAGGDGTPFHVEQLRALQLTLIGFSSASANPADLIASYRRVADLAAAGTLVLPTAVYGLDEAADAWDMQASSPGKKIVLVP